MFYWGDFLWHFFLGGTGDHLLVQPISTCDVNQIAKHYREVNKTVGNMG
jgi:hypothetical protein